MCEFRGSPGPPSNEDQLLVVMVFHSVPSLTVLKSLYQLLLLRKAWGQLPLPKPWLPLVPRGPLSLDPPSASLVAPGSSSGACVSGPWAQVGLYLQELVCLCGDPDSELRP